MPDWYGSDPNSVFNSLTPAAVNPFDQFDAQDFSSLSPRYSGVYGQNAQVVQPKTAPANTQPNPFDRFDQAAPDSATRSALRGAANAVTFNLADPAVAALQATFGDPTNPTSQAADWSTRYHEDLGALRGVDRQNQSAHPVASLAGEVAGGLALPVGRIAGVVDAARVGGKLGLAYGIGSGIADDKGVDDTVMGGINGALGGALTGGILNRVGGAVSNAIKPSVGPVINALKDAARAAYNRFDASDAMISADALNQLGDKAVDAFADRIDPTIHPRASAALKAVARYGTEGELGASGAPITKLDTLRRIVADAAQSGDKEDRNWSRQILDHVDDFVDQLGPQHLDTTALDAARSDLMTATARKGSIARAIKDIEANQSGALAARGAAGAGTRARYMQLRQDLLDAEDARQAALGAFGNEQAKVATSAGSAVRDLNMARDYWRRYAKASTLQGIIDKAKLNSTGFSQSGYENALRAGFRKLANNDRGISRFSPDERAAIIQVATGGGKLSPTNVLRQVGKLSPHGAIPILSEIGMYGALGPQALAVPAVGIAGRAGATALQKAAARRAVEISAMGAPGAAAITAQAVPPSVRRLLAIRAAQSLPRLTPAVVPATQGVWQ